MYFWLSQVLYNKDIAVVKVEATKLATRVDILLVLVSGNGTKG